MLSGIYIAIVGFLAIKLLRSLGGFRLRHLRYLSYPSSLWGGFIAGIVLFAMRRSGLLVASFDKVDWITVLTSISLLALIAIIYELPAGSYLSSLFDKLSRWLSCRRVSATSSELAESWSAIERPIESADDDRFDHQFIAKRITRRLLGESKATVGIVGEYGSGKSSIVNMVKQQASYATERELWFCEVECWGFHDASAAIEGILEGIVQRIGEQIDCAAMSTLPYQYAKAISATHPYLNAMESLLGKRTEPENIINELDRALIACDVRLVVAIQDLDRNAGAKFDTSAVAALLARFRDSTQICFILAAGRLPELDFTRLCEHIEPIPRLPRNKAKEVLSRLREDCLQFFKDEDIDLGSAEQRRQFDTEVALGWFRPITESIVALVNTPRKLKFLDRRVRVAWESLHGEIDIDDLIVVTALRYSSPEAVDFLHQYRHELVFGANEGYASSLGERQEEQNKQLAARFEEVIASAPGDSDSLRHLIDFLFPGASKILGGRSSLNRNSLQGVSARSHVDYWSRAFAEEISPNEIRDQEVIDYIDDCKVDKNAIKKLANRMIESEAFCNGWEYFASRMPSPDLYQLAETLFKVLLDKHGASASGEHWAIIRVWRVVNRRPAQTRDRRQWLVIQLRKALRQSLGFYNDIFHYWTGKHGIVSSSEVQTMRDEMLAYARRYFSAGRASAFVKSLSPQHPGALRHFVVPHEHYEGLVAPASAGQWDWFLPTLQRAVRTAPELVLPQLTRLISKDIDQSHFDEDHMARVSFRTSVVDRDLTHAIFGTRKKWILEKIVSFPFESTVDLDLERSVAVRESAREWLDELR
ncbi:P-loop NTPase fold protein [Lacipirellula sp.]|uniref:P-loop NTPase fold protein n=1 Tax=Lacipirellula sp. TaxID=2691419 RepID=UPI003D0E77D0